MPDFSQFYELKPPIVLWLVLHFVAFSLKRIPTFPDWLIPITLMTMGAVTYPLVTDPGQVSFAVRCPLCAQVFTGAMAGGIAVATHTQFKQLVKRFGWSTGDTDFIKKERN